LDALNSLCATPVPALMYWQVTRLNHGAVAHAVLVLERAFQHVRNDLHIAVRVLRKPPPPATLSSFITLSVRNCNMLGIEVIGKRKGEMRIQPAVVRVRAFVAFADINHGPPPGSCKHIILVITTIVKRYILPLAPAPPPFDQPFAFVRFAPPFASFRRRPLWCTVITKARLPLRGLRGIFNGLPIVRNNDEKPEGSPTPRETLTITDNRTGKSYEVPITTTPSAPPTSARSKSTPKIRYMSYDPAFNNTASCISKITFIDGDAGIPALIAGIPSKDLAEKSNLPETAYLLLAWGIAHGFAAEGLDLQRPRTTLSSTKASRNSWTAFITTPTPWA